MYARDAQTYAIGLIFIRGASSGNPGELWWCRNQVSNLGMVDVIE